MRITFLNCKQFSIIMGCGQVPLQLLCLAEGLRLCSSILVFRNANLFLQISSPLLCSCCSLVRGALPECTPHAYYFLKCKDVNSWVLLAESLDFNIPVILKLDHHWYFCRVYSVLNYRQCLPLVLHVVSFKSWQGYCGLVARRWGPPPSETALPNHPPNWIGTAM